MDPLDRQLLRVLQLGIAEVRLHVHHVLLLDLGYQTFEAICVRGGRHMR